MIFIGNGSLRRGRAATLAAALFFCAMASNALAQAPEDSFSLSGGEIPEVVVTGARYPADLRQLSQTVSILERRTIENSLEPSLLPVLSEQVPGLFVTSRGIMGYGVSDGSAGNISLRGLGGASARIMLLVDGHPQYMGLMGHPIADVCQGFMAERVEVLRGPASVLYGSNAMGGAINIVTRKMDQEGVRTDLRLGGGSYGTFQSEFATRVKKGRLTSSAGASYDRTDGHRANLGFEQYGGYAKLGYGLSDNWTLRAEAQITHFNASQPGSTDAPLEDAYQRITRGNASASLENDYERSSGALSFFCDWGRHWINDGHSRGESPLDYRFLSHDHMLGISWYQSARLFEGNRLTAGIDWYRSSGRAMNRYIQGDMAGEDSMIADVTVDETAAYADFRQDLRQWLTLDAGVRVDHHSVAGTSWVPQAGVSLHLPRTIELKASASKGFRFATIKEMYMFPPQNPDLEPESMWNYEIAFSQTLAQGRLSYGVNLFYIDGRNIIVTVPRQGATPLNMNTGRIKNTGVELQMAWRISRAWSADANYSFLHMEDPVIASPEHKLYVGADFNKGRWHLSTGIQYVEGLYTSVSPDVQENFVLWNLRGSFRATKWLSLWVKGENLLAQKYEINLGYPMPKATFTGGVDISF